MTSCEFQDFKMEENEIIFNQCELDEVTRSKDSLKFLNLILRDKILQYKYTKNMLEKEHA